MSASLYDVVNIVGGHRVVISAEEDALMRRIEHLE